MAEESIPTLIVSGTIGAGKTALADEIAVVLNEQRIPHGLIDVDWLCQLYPRTLGSEPNPPIGRTSLAMTCDSMARPNHAPIIRNVLSKNERKPS